MTKRTVRFRQRAAADVEAAVDHYRLEAGEAVALDLVAALEEAVTRIRRSPQLGSLRYSYEVDIPELRAIRTRRFPYVIFYLAGDDAIDIWRVLHDRRDIPAALAPDA